jgi:hypothetical protein
MIKEGATNFYAVTYGTDDPNIRYVRPDGYAPNVAFRVDRESNAWTSNLAKVLVSANDDCDRKVIEGLLYMDSAQLRKLAQDATRAADLLDA